VTTAEEKIMKGSYNNERFTSSSLLIIFNRIYSILTGLVIIYFKTSSFNQFKSRLSPNSNYSSYAAVAIFNFLSTSCQYQALRYVT
jgi:hypothetical protein